MNTLFKTLFFLLLTITLHAQQDDIVKDIRERFQDVNTKPDWQQDTFYIEGMSTEGGEAIIFHDNADTGKIIVRLAGEMGNNFYEFYLKNNCLIFIYSIQTQYNRPIYWTKERAAEIGDTEYFDPEKFIIIKNRRYFYDGHLYKEIKDEEQAKVSFEGVDETLLKEILEKME